MFSDEMLSKIYSAKEVQEIPISYLITTINVIQRVLEEYGYDFQFQSFFSAGGDTK